MEAIKKKKKKTAVVLMTIAYSQPTEIWQHIGLQKPYKWITWEMVINRKSIRYSPKHTDSGVTTQKGVGTASEFLTSWLNLGHTDSNKDIMFSWADVRG